MARQLLTFYLEVYIYSNYIGRRPTYGGYDSGLSTLANYLSTARYSGYLYPDFSSYTFGWKPIGGHYSFGGYNGFWGSGGLWGAPNFNWWQGPVGFNYYFGWNPWNYYPYPTSYYNPSYSPRYTPSYKPNVTSPPVASPTEGLQPETKVTQGKGSPTEPSPPSPPQPPSQLPAAAPPTKDAGENAGLKPPTVAEAGKTGIPLYPPPPPKPLPPPLPDLVPIVSPTLAAPAQPTIEKFNAEVTLDQVSSRNKWEEDVAKAIADQIAKQDGFKTSVAGKTIKRLSVGVTVSKDKITALRHNKKAIQAMVAKLLKKGNTTIKEMRLNFKEQEVATKPAVPPPSPKAAAPEKAANAHLPAEEPFHMPKPPPPPPTIASIPSFSTTEPASKSEPAVLPAPEPTIPDWQRPYKVKDLQKVVAIVDFNLPSVVIEDFDGWLEKQKAANSEQLVEEVTKWALDYTSDWSDTDKEILSVAKACDERRGDCSERTSFLYALMMHAKGKLRDQKLNLNGVKFDFAQIFDFESINDHVCLTANIKGQTKFYDIAGNAQESGVVTPEYKKYVCIGNKEYIAMLLCHKGAEMKKAIKRKTRDLTNFGRDDPDPRLLAIYQRAYQLAPDNAFVLMRVASTYYNIAGEYCATGEWENARTYHSLANQRFASIKNSLGHEYIADANDLKANLPLLASAIEKRNSKVRFKTL